MTCANSQHTNPEGKLKIKRTYTLWKIHRETEAVLKAQKIKTRKRKRRWRQAEAERRRRLLFRLLQRLLFRFLFRLLRRLLFRLLQRLLLRRLLFRLLLRRLLFRLLQRLLFRLLLLLFVQRRRSRKDRIVVQPDTGASLAVKVPAGTVYAAFAGVVG